MTKFNQKQFSWVSATTVCFIASMFYLYEFSLQVAPSVMTQQIMTAFGVTSVGLGAISAFYYYAYTPMQVPAGILYDHFGPRILLTIATSICAVGGIIFSLGHSVLAASLARFMMGFGSAFAFIGALVLLSRWFPPYLFALLAGIVQAMSSIGAIGGQIPLAMAVDSFGWQKSIWVLSLIGLGLAAVIWFVVRDYPVWNPKPAKVKQKQQLGILQVLNQRQTWWIALYSFCIWAPVVIFSALWGIPFLTALYGISTTQASNMMAMMWIGIGIGSPLVGWHSDRMQLRRWPLVYCAIIGMIASLFVIYISIPVWLMYLAIFALGFSAAGQSLAFGVVKDINKPKTVGTAIGLNNMAVVAGGAVFQPLVGYILHFFWHGERFAGAPVYSIGAYQRGLVIIPVVCFICFVVSQWFIKETHCQPSYNYSE